MDRQESVLLTNGSGRALPEPGLLQDSLAGIREESGPLALQQKPCAREQAPQEQQA